FALNVRISRHPGLNAAYWNLHERHFQSVNGQHFVNGQPLRFFHFSGYSLDKPDALTKHWTRFTFENRPDMRPIFAEYQHHLKRVSQGSAGNTQPAQVTRTNSASIKPRSSASSHLARSRALEATGQHRLEGSDNVDRNFSEATPEPLIVKSPADQPEHVTFV